MITVCIKSSLSLFEATERIATFRLRISSIERASLLVRRWLEEEDG